MEDNHKEIKEMDEYFLQNNKITAPFPRGCKCCRPDAFHDVQKHNQLVKKILHRKKRRNTKKNIDDITVYDTITPKTVNLFKKIERLNRDQSSKKYTHHQLSSFDEIFD